MFYTTINEGIFSKILGIKSYKCILSEEELYDIVNSSLEITKLGIKKANSKVNKFKNYFKFLNVTKNEKGEFADQFHMLSIGETACFAYMYFDEALGIDDYYDWLDTLSETDYRKYLKYNLFVRKAFSDSITKEYNRYRDKEIIKKFNFDFNFDQDDEEEAFNVYIKIPKEYFKEVE